MAGIFGSDLRLQRENERLKRELARVKADYLDVQHENSTLKEDNAQLKQFAFGLGAYGEQINQNLVNQREAANEQFKALQKLMQCLAEGQERNFRAVSDQFSNVTGALDAQDQQIQQLGQRVSDEAAQVRAAIDELKNQGNLGPQIQAIADRIVASSDRLAQVGEQIGAIYEPDPPLPGPVPVPDPPLPGPEPEPSPQPIPTPEPGRGRR